MITYEPLRIECERILNFLYKHSRGMGFIKFKRKLSDYTKLVVTGKTKSFKPRNFKPRVYNNDIGGQLTVFGINLWRGTIWGVLPNGKKEVIKRVYN